MAKAYTKLLLLLLMLAFSAVFFSLFFLNFVAIVAENMLCNNFPVCNGNKPTNFVDMVAKEMGGCGKEIVKELQFSGMQAGSQPVGR